ncbi:MAG TPA: HPF/RaiA family ribosome-associated protein [Myxococcaceae bacterium]|nr:HPF/RaiA family ribosome-associated protein [Myxococcaceae bacterium]
MLIQVNTDKHIEGNEELRRRVHDVVEGALGRYNDRISRVEVHLSDQNSGDRGGGNDKRCTLEVRLEGRPPTAVSHAAPTVEQAIDGAADKANRAVESTLERLSDLRRGGQPRT